jgi:hypothetical protein
MVLTTPQTFGKYVFSQGFNRQPPQIVLALYGILCYYCLTGRYAISGNHRHKERT